MVILNGKVWIAHEKVKISLIKLLNLIAINSAKFLIVIKTPIKFLISNTASMMLLELAWTGMVSMGVFQMLLAGKMSQLPIFGGGDCADTIEDNMVEIAMTNGLIIVVVLSRRSVWYGLV